MIPSNPALCAIAQNCSALVHTVRDETEAHFLRTGAALVSVCERFETVERPIGALSDLATAGEVQGLVGQIRHFENMLQSLLYSVREARVPLGQTLEKARSMHGVVAQLSRTIRTMNIVTLNARVAVAPMVDAKSSMSVFTRDAAELVQHAFRKLAEIEQALSDLDAQVAVSRTQSGELGRMLDERAAAALGEIVAGLTRLEDHIGTLTMRGGKLSRAALTIRDAVAKSVLALQAGDAMRQRLEHIETMLAAVCDTAPGGGMQAALLSLSQRQMFDASERHAPNIAMLERQLRLAASQTTTFLGNVEEVFRPGQSGINDLLNAFSEIERVLADAALLQLSLGSNARSLTEAVDRVQTLVKEIGALEARMNLIGINAVIACSSLGQDGLPLKVIAHQLRDLVEQSSGCVVQMQGDLGGMRRTAQEVAELLDQQAQETQSIREGLETQVTPGLTNLRSALQAVRTAVSANQSQLSGGLQDGLSAMEAHRAGIEAMVQRVGVTISSQPRMRQFTLTPAEAALVSAIRSILSIEAERTVHDAWLSSIGVDASGLEVSLPQAVGSDIVLF